ncbi:hypothetical protein C7123_02720 [Tannerella serpentiformis]|nr:hypothetical protein C7123_02720 [Tannerella serpentiformis]
MFDALIISSNDLIEIVGAIFAYELCYDRDRPVSLIALADTLAVSATISAWKIFYLMCASKLSDAAPTNVPCLRSEILFTGIILSICILIEVDTS